MDSFQKAPWGGVRLGTVLTVSLTVAAVLGMASAGQAGVQLYITADAGVVRYDFDTASMGTLVPETLDYALFNGLTFGPNGHLFIAATLFAPQIWEFDASTGAQIGSGPFVFYQGMPPSPDPHDVIEPRGLLFSPLNGNLYVADLLQGNVHIYSPTGASLGALSDGMLNQDADVAFDAAGNLYVPNPGFANVLMSPGGTGPFVEFVAVQSGGLTNPTALTFGPDGKLYVLDQSTWTIYRYNTDGSFDTIVVAFPLFQPYDLEFGPDGILYISGIDLQSAAGQVLRYSADGVDLSPLIESGLTNPRFLAFLPVGACCQGDLCTIGGQSACGSGTFLGLGSTCDGSPCERAHPGWNAVDVAIELTANQPTYWSALTGQPATGGVSPFTILDPANIGLGELPGRPTTDGSGERVLRGFVVAWAVGLGGQEIRWNHLNGDALIVNYDSGAAWEYNAYAFQVVNPAVAHGGDVPGPGLLQLNGLEYDHGFELLLFDFYASQGMVFGTGSTGLRFDTELTLMPLDIDLRQESAGPVTTKASFTVWNQNETKLTGLDRCVTCWDSTLLSLYDAPNHFLADNLQTNRGKAQIDGLTSQRCNVDFDPTDGPIGTHPLDVTSQAAPLLGVEVRHVTFESAPYRGLNGNSHQRELPGESLVGMGAQSATLQADLLGFPPPQRPASESPPTGTAVAPASPLRTRPGVALAPAPVIMAASDRTSTNEKGSLLIFPKVELRWDATGQLIQDTFLDIANDYPDDVTVQMYFVNGDAPLP